MTYAVTGLPLEDFRPLFALSDDELAARGVIRRTVDATPGYPCRVSLRDAAPGDTVLLMNYESHSARTPFRSAYAIYVSEAAKETLRVIDALPPVFHGRTIALRVFDAGGMLIGAELAQGEAIDTAIRHAFETPEAAYIHAHNAAQGCFAALIERA